MDLHRRPDRLLPEGVPGYRPGGAGERPDERPAARAGGLWHRQRSHQPGLPVKASHKPNKADAIMTPIHLCLLKKDINVS